jgi:hypothetical protein
MIRSASQPDTSSNARRAYAAPAVERMDISKTETGVINPTEFLAIIGPTS